MPYIFLDNNLPLNEVLLVKIPIEIIIEQLVTSVSRNDEFLRVFELVNSKMKDVLESWRHSDFYR